MNGRLTALLMLFVTLVAASPAVIAQVTRPSTVQASSHFPTPTELLQQIKAQHAADDKLLKVAYIDLNEEVGEKPASFAIFGDPDTLTVHTVIERLHKVRDDKSIRAALITLGDTNFNFAQAQEIRHALSELRQAGKRTFVYADAYDTATYTMATGATDICILGGGEIMMPGVGLQTMFAKDLLGKVGVQADYVQIGEYKGADEEFTRTGPSDELRGELNKLVDSLYD